MPVVQLAQEDRQQLFLPRTENDPNTENRLWVVLDVSPPMGKDMMDVSAKDPSGLVVLKKVVSRLREWNFLQADGQAHPINLDTVGSLLTEDEIVWLYLKIKQAEVVPAEVLSAAEKKA